MGVHHMSLKAKAFFLLFISTTMAGCISQPTSTSTYQIPAAIAGLNVGVHGYKSQENLRKVRINVDASSVLQSDLTVSYTGSQGDGLAYKINYKEAIPLVDKKFQGEIDVPIGEDAFVSGDLDSYEHKVSGYKLIKPTDNDVKVVITVDSYSDLIRKEFRSKSSEEQRRIIELIGTIEEALNSPRYLASSVLSKSETELRLLVHDSILEYFSDTSSFIRGTISDFKSGIAIDSHEYITRVKRKLHVLRLATI